MPEPTAPSARFRSARFWLVTLAALVVMVVTASLGRWQLGRAQLKLDLQASIEARGAQPALDTPAVLAVASTEALLHRQAQLQGQWVAAATVWLENRPMAGRSGFIVVTPLRLEGSERTVLVQRGWVPRDFQDRTRLPALDTPQGMVQVRGRLAPPPSRLFEPGAAAPGPIRQNIELAAYARETGLALLDLSLLQTGDAGDGLLRDWPRFAADVSKHHGYAFQWFGLCALTGLLYVWFQFIAPRRQRHRPAP